MIVIALKITINVECKTYKKVPITVKKPDYSFAELIMFFLLVTLLVSL